ncbi:MAG: PP2C family protein-serine/threonine phosphatase, partial [Vicinamibacterales bacterium]
MAIGPTTPGRDAALWETLKRDWQHLSADAHLGWRDSVRRTLSDLREFYLSPGERQRYVHMGRFKRFVFVSWWLLKGLFFKLSPWRRLIFALAVLSFFGFDESRPREGGTVITFEAPTFGTLLLVGLLLLELKDKLLARHELEAGRAVQMALMPDACPHVPGWDVWLFTRPANDVGGDLVDCLQVHDDRLAIVLADVAGKALPAALLMAKVQSTLRALASDASSLEDLAAQTNTILCRDGLPNRFATMVYLELLHDSGVVRLVNAGHMPPVRISDAGVTELLPGNLALGLMPGATYEEHVLDLPASNMLVVYSDGLTEAMNDAGAFFGDEHFRPV